MSSFGLSTALLTPFDNDGSIAWAQLENHVRQVLANGSDTVTLFGTSGECASISNRERNQGLDRLLAAGCKPSQCVLGVCAPAVDDAVDQVQTGIARGVNRFLLIPPFYFKDCSDSGLLQWHLQLFKRAPSEARYVLYHIPQVTGIHLSGDLLHQIGDHAPDQVLAVKDSSGDWRYAKALLRSERFQVLVGDERLLHKAIALGGGGAISGMANLYPARLRHIVQTGQEDQDLSAEVARLVKLPVIPAIKTLLAEHYSDDRWQHVRPPLVCLNEAQRDQVLLNSQAVA